MRNNSVAKPKVRFAIDMKKLERDIKKASGLEAKQALQTLKNQELEGIGNGVIAEMRLLISKGISPIKGAGRFPAYKWAGVKFLARKSGTKKKQADRQFQSKYPYSVQDEFPQKKERPVNLTLSGEFLNNLIVKVKNKVIEIGFFEAPWTKYEQGHREGSNGQPPRPIIPISGEEFSPSIYRRLVKTIQSVFDRRK